MITGWVLKLAIGIALLFVLTVEVGSPLIVRAQLDDRAQNAANAAVRRLREGASKADATREAKESAGDTFRDVHIAEDGTVTVSVQQTATSFVVARYVDRLKSWYDVRVTATAP